MKITVWKSEVKLDTLLLSSQISKIQEKKGIWNYGIYLQVITSWAKVYVDTIDDSTVATWIMIDEDNSLPFDIVWIENVSLISDTEDTDVRVLVV